LHGDLVIRESKEFFAQAVGLLFRPLGCQEVFDGGGSLQEVGAVAPDTVGGIGFGYAFGVSFVALLRGEIRRKLEGGCSYCSFQRS
jgi:hypothetical protein